MEKVNFQENTLFYLNQSYLIVKKKKKIFFYCDHFIVGQIIELSNLAQDVSSCTLKENEVKMVRPRYDPEAGEFKSLYETIGYLVLRDSPKKVVLNYGFDREKSKVLHSSCRRRIPNSLSGTMFNRHRMMIESREVDSYFSNIYFYLSAITDRLEEINQYLNNVSISISQEQLDT